VDKYFAIEARLDDLNEKVEEFYQQLWDMGVTSRVQKSFYTYFGRNGASTGLQKAGSQGQLNNIMINDYRGLCQHVTTLVTANRPSFDVRATNTDYKSVAQCKLGELILEYYMRENKVENLLKKQCDYAIKYAEGWIGLDWDANMGEIAGMTEEGRPYMEGDIRFSLYHMLQVIRDIYKEGEQDWVITAQKVNKYELAAKFPSSAEEILRLDNSTLKSEQRDLDYLVRGGDAGDTDVIPFYTFYHRKSAALPEGRLIFFVETKKLLDSPLPYDSIPLSRLAPKDFDGTSLGYSPMWDLLGIQEASDKLYSAVVSNNVTFAKQVIQTSRDNDINVSDLADGMMLVESDAELKPVNLTKSAPETYNLLGTLQSKMQELSGINEVVRGVPGPNLRSGNALAIVAAQAITFNSDISASYNMAVEVVGTLVLRMLKKFAKHPRYISIVGKYNKAYLKEFKSDDIYDIDRVTVQQRNAVMSTTAGKVELASNLLQNGVITKPEQYMMVVETGNLDMLTDPTVIEGMLIQQENEKIADGITPMAVLSDSHAKHLVDHKAVLANIEARENPKVVEAYIQHVQQHIDILRNTDPAVLQMLGNQPLPPPQGMEAAPINEVQAAPSPGQPPMNMPSQPNLPEGADQMTAQSYDQLQQLSGGAPQ
jgi:hypothetical protein